MACASSRPLQLQEGLRSHRCSKMAMFKIEEIPDAFKNDLGIRISNGTESVLDELIEEFTGVGHVEVACKGKIPAGRIVPSNQWMAIGSRVASMGSISQVPDVDLAEIPAAVLQGLEVRAAVLQLNRFKVALHRIEDAFNGVVPG